jgi:pimeloyl-ACP methyl ester carboxylesterase
MEETRTSLPPRVEAWRRRGHVEEFRGRRIHCFHQEGRGPLLLLLHGYPSSSYDWRGLIELEPERAILAFDFLGFGLSDKPHDHEYSLLWQADLAEELVRRHGGGAVEVVAHDMGTSVATELLARDLEGKPGIEIDRMTLSNGSMIMERASLVLGQKLLRSRLGPLFARMASGWFFRSQLGSVFSEGHPMTAEEGEDQWALMRVNGGNRIADKLIHYSFERVTRADRWHSAIRDWQKPLAFAWGLKDPVATTNVLEGLRELRPTAPVAEMPTLGHYPQIEDPSAFQAALAR